MRELFQWQRRWAKNSLPKKKDLPREEYHGATEWRQLDKGKCCQCGAADMWLYHAVGQLHAMCGRCATHWEAELLVRPKKAG